MARGIKPENLTLGQLFGSGDNLPEEMENIPVRGFHQRRNLNICCVCGIYLGPDDFDGICWDCGEEEEEATQ